MDTAYINEAKAQATCCWNAPDRATIEAVFAKAGVTTELVEEVVQYAGA